jgi:ribose-phosphate pyrophosphokinase
MPIKVYQKNVGLEYEFPKHTFKFHAGEVHTKISPLDGCYVFPSPIYIKFDFDGSDSIIELLMVVDVLRREYDGLDLVLEMPYVPFGRGDQVQNPGEPFPLEVFANLINSLNFKQVIIEDAHSKVTPALIHRCKEIRQSQIHHLPLEGRHNYWLVAVDEGSSHKIFEVAQTYNRGCLGIIQCTKIRDTKDKGKIIRTDVHFDWFNDDEEAVMVDDIADGGKTFIEVAKILREKCCKKITLMVTHGFFFKGLDVFDGLIDEIYTREGRVK